MGRVDHAKARAFYEKSCKLDDGVGCFNLGNVFRLGEGVPIDLRRALAEFERACDLDTATGCTEAAIIHYEGEVGPQDLTRVSGVIRQGLRARQPGSMQEPRAATRRAEVSRGPSRPKPARRDREPMTAASAAHVCVGRARLCEDRPYLVEVQAIRSAAWTAWICSNDGICAGPRISESSSSNQESAGVAEGGASASSGSRTQLPSASRNFTNPWIRGSVGQLLLLAERGRDALVALRVLAVRLGGERALLRGPELVIDGLQTAGDLLEELLPRFDRTPAARASTRSRRGRSRTGDDFGPRRDPPARCTNRACR